MRRLVIALLLLAGIAILVAASLLYAMIPGLAGMLSYLRDVMVSPVAAVVAIAVLFRKPFSGLIDVLAERMRTGPFRWTLAGLAVEFMQMAAQAENAEQPYVPEPGVEGLKYRRLHSSLSALRLNATQLVNEISRLQAGGNPTNDKIAVFLWAHRCREWMKGVQRVLEAWDRVEDSRALAQGDPMPNVLDAGDLDSAKAVTLEWLNERMARVEKVMREVEGK